MAVRHMALVAFLVGVSACQPAAIEGPGIVVFDNITLIDGTGSTRRPGTSVVVTDGRISHIANAGDLRFGVSVEVVAGEGLYLLPGFIDTHAHVLGPRIRSARLQRLLDYGITAARSPASRANRGVAVRDSIERGDLIGPTFRVAGPLLDSPGSPHSWADMVETPSEARAAVRAQAATGVDFVKLYTLLPARVVSAAIEEAHLLDLPVIGHLGRTSWSDAVDLGIDALTHSAIGGLASSMVPPQAREEFSDFFIPNAAFNAQQLSDWLAAVDGQEEIVRDLGRRIAEANVVLDPNLVLMEAVLRGNDPELHALLVPSAPPTAFSPHPYAVGFTDREWEAAGAALEYFFDAVRIFHEEGALITVGTDIGNPWVTPGHSFHRELELLVQAGIPAPEVVLAATRNGAIALGLLDELGTIETGKRGDLVLLRADPLADITNSRAIEAVYKGGTLVSTE